jgi:hypothetical protein
MTLGEDLPWTDAFIEEPQLVYEIFEAQFIKRLKS